MSSERSILNNLAVLIAFFLFLSFASGTANALDTSGLFGGGNYVHPFISLDTVWSDNIYETHDNKESDTIVYTRPGIWFALPGADRQIISLETASESPGGTTLTRFNDNEMVRYQTYLLYTPEFENYLDQTDHNEINHKAEGYFLYNFPGGLSFELLDQYVVSHDDIVEGEDNLTYANNYLSPTLSFSPTEKLQFRVDYSLYDVNYDSQADVKDRVDSTVSAYVFFKIMPKTSLFFQYYNTDIDYDNTTDTLKSIDSTEEGYLLGIKWDITDKTTGIYKAGYQSKDFDGSGYDDTTSLKMELKANYDLTSRSSISLTEKNEFTETDEDNAYYIHTNTLLMVYEQSLTERFTGFLGLSYIHEDYGELDRKDVTFDISPSLAYTYNDLLTFNAAYTFENVRSKGTADVEDYRKNSILLSVSASL